MPRKDPGPTAALTMESGRGVSPRNLTVAFSGHILFLIKGVEA